jgi:cell division protein FtsL
MAARSTVWDVMFETRERGPRSGAEARGSKRQGGLAPRGGRGEDQRVRPFPNEDIYFFVKRIDNTRVVREADPEARKACWQLIGSVAAAVGLLIRVLMPSAYGLLFGYQVQSLRQERQRLVTEQSSLEVEESKLMSPARMEELAREQQFIDPAPQKVVYLESQNGGSLALNKKK